MNHHICSTQHLFTCEMDGQELKKVSDCVAKLKRLDAKGRLWPQEMIMEVQGRHLQLNDIETRVGLHNTLQIKSEEFKFKAWHMAIWLGNSRVNSGVTDDIIDPLSPTPS